MNVAGRLDRLRQGRQSETAVVTVFVAGLLASSVHWVGLVVAGGTIGIVATSTTRAFVLGVYFGTFVLLAYGVVLAWYGTLGTVAGAFPLSVGLLAIAVVLPTLTAVIVRFGTRLDTDD
jgi:hypothetical protein